MKQGEIIGWLESNASTQEVIDLSKKLESSTELLGQSNPSVISTMFNQRFKNLGELQVPYQTFVTAWQEYNDYLVNGFYYRRKTMLNSDIASLQNMKGKTTVQKSITQQETSLPEKLLR